MHHDSAIPKLIAVQAFEQGSGLSHILGWDQPLRLDFCRVGGGAVVHDPPNRAVGQLVSVALDLRWVVSWWRGAGIKCAVYMQPIASEAVEPVRFSIILDQLLDVSRPAVSAPEPGFAHPCHGGAGVAVEHSGTAQPITKKVLKSKERVPRGAQLILGGFMACMYYPMARVPSKSRFVPFVRRPDIVSRRHAAASVQGRS